MFKPIWNVYPETVKPQKNLQELFSFNYIINCLLSENYQNFWTN